MPREELGQRGRWWGGSPVGHGQASGAGGRRCTTAASIPGRIRCICCIEMGRRRRGWGGLFGVTEAEENGRERRSGKGSGSGWLATAAAACAPWGSAPFFGNCSAAERGCVTAAVGI